MADAIDSSLCSLIGLGRAAVLEPTIPRNTLLNPSVPDERAIGIPHIVKGQWLARMIPIKVIGSGLGIQFFYHNMRRLGRGLTSDPDMSIPKMLWTDGLESFRSGFAGTIAKLVQGLRVHTWGMNTKFE